MRSSRNRTGAAHASVLAGLVIGALLVLAACGTGEGDGAPQRSALPSAVPSLARPSAGEPDGAASATRTEQARPTLDPDRTTAAPPPATTTPAAAAPPRATTTPAAAAPTSAAPATPSESGGLGMLGWLVLLGVVATIIVGGMLLHRSQQKSAWENQARALEGETRTVTATRLPLVLTATTAEKRGLAWPPVRDNLVDLINRWDALTLRARDEPQRNRSTTVSGLLQDLTAAVDAENQALAYDNNWMLLRPRVTQAEQALAAALRGSATTVPA